MRTFLILRSLCIPVSPEKRTPTTVPLLIRGRELSSAAGWIQAVNIFFFFLESRFFSVAGVYSCIKLSVLLFREESIKNLG